MTKFGKIFCNLVANFKGGGSCLSCTNKANRAISRGCTCLRSALPLARARTAPTKQTVQTIGGYGILPYPRSHQTIFPQNPQKPLAEISSHRCHRCSQIFLAEIFSHGLHRTRRILVHPVCAIVGGYGIPAIPTHPPRGCSGLHCTNKAATASSHRIHRIHRNLLLKYPPTDVTDTHRYFLLRYPPTDVTDAHRYFLLRYFPTDCTEHAEF